jgi:sortase A
MRSLLASAAVVATVLAGAVALPAAPATAAPDATPSNGKPRDARLTIPKLPRITRLPVLAYRGWTDDAPGTRIQNRGIAAAPYGPRGGVGPGGIGNYQVTAHRSSHGAIFWRTPSLQKGDKVWVEVGKWRYVYVIHQTRWVSFRSAESLRKQRAAVPGKPGTRPTKALITISTCATPEDRARGNFWTDRFGNPEHRIDKIGKLVKRVEIPRKR